MTPEALASCLAQLRSAGCRWDLQVFGGGVVHAFSNPAQSLNAKPEFDFDEHSARASWQAALLFLEEVFECEQ